MTLAPFHLFLIIITPFIIISISQHQAFLSSAFAFIIVGKSSHVIIFTLFSIFVTTLSSCVEPCNSDGCAQEEYWHDNDYNGEDRHDAGYDQHLFYNSPFGYEGEDKEYDAYDGEREHSHEHDDCDEEDESDNDGGDHNEGDTNKKYDDDVVEDDNGDSNDLDRRIDEFITMVNSKWREELVNDKLHMIEA